MPDAGQHLGARHGAWIVLANSMFRHEQQRSMDAAYTQLLAAEIALRMLMRRRVELSGQPARHAGAKEER
jgi:hypothetical protein